MNLSIVFLSVALCDSDSFFYAQPRELFPHTFEGFCSDSLNRLTQTQIQVDFFISLPDRGTVQGCVWDVCGCQQVVDGLNNKTCFLFILAFKV